MMETVERRISDLELTDTVRILGSIPRADQLLLVRGAGLVMQPSHFEGWSSIVEEARSFGKTILLSDIPVHREQAPPQAVYFDPLDPAALADVIEQAWQQVNAVDADADGERQALMEHKRLQVEAGRALVAMAKEGMRLFDSLRHDPVRILADMVCRAAHLTSNGDLTQRFVVEAVRVWFSYHPWRFPGFAAALLQADETSIQWARSSLLPMLSHHVATEWRREARSDPTRLFSAYPELVETVSRVALLAGLPFAPARQDARENP